MVTPDSDALFPAPSVIYFLFAEPGTDVRAVLDTRLRDAGLERDPETETSADDRAYINQSGTGRLAYVEPSSAFSSQSAYEAAFARIHYALPADALSLSNVLAESGEPPPVSSYQAQNFFLAIMGYGLPQQVPGPFREGGIEVLAVPRMETLDTRLTSENMISFFAAPRLSRYRSDAT